MKISLKNSKNEITLTWIQPKFPENWKDQVHKPQTNQNSSLQQQNGIIKRWHTSKMSKQKTNRWSDTHPHTHNLHNVGVQYCADQFDCCRTMCQHRQRHNHHWLLLLLDSTISMFLQTVVDWLCSYWIIVDAYRQMPNRQQRKYWYRTTTTRKRWRK